MFQKTEKIITENAGVDFFYDVTLPFDKLRLGSAQGPSISLRSAQGLTVRQAQELILEKKAKGYSLSPNKKKILFWTDFELWIYDLKTLQEETLQQAQGEILARYSKEIIDALWHPENNYVIFAFSNSIQAIELDDRDGKNMIELIKADNIEDLLMMKKGEIYFKRKVAGKKGVFKIKVQ